jgi:DNA-binding transcriptional LysR family regulator
MRRRTWGFGLVASVIAVGGMADSVPQDMVAVRFGGDTRFVAVASARYLKHHAPPRSPSDLQKHTCIRYRMRSGRIYRWEFERRGQSCNVDVEGPLTLDDDDLMAQAAADGLGIAFVPERGVLQSIKAGKLVALLDEWCPRIPWARPVLSRAPAGPGWTAGIRRRAQGNRDRPPLTRFVAGQQCFPVTAFGIDALPKAILVSFLPDIHRSGPSSLPRQLGRTT